MINNGVIDIELMCLQLLSLVCKEDSLFLITKMIEIFFQADSVSILELKGTKLNPVALFGISKETYGRRFELEDNPRLKIISEKNNPTIFPDNIGLPDPFDGLIENKADKLEVHSCSGIPIKENGSLRGIITLDSMEQGKFKKFPSKNFDDAAFIVSKVVLQVIDNYNLKEMLAMLFLKLVI